MLPILRISYWWKVGCLFCLQYIWVDGPCLAHLSNEKGPLGVFSGVYGMKSFPVEGIIKMNHDIKILVNFLNNQYNPYHPSLVYLPAFSGFVWLSCSILYNRSIPFKQPVWLWKVPVYEPLLPIYNAIYRGPMLNTICNDRDARVLADPSPGPIGRCGELASSTCHCHIATRRRFGGSRYW